MNRTVSEQPLLELRGVSRTYGTGGPALTVLLDIDLRIDAGEMVAIVGASGSGKSTLMNLLGCLDRPTTGTYSVAGQSISELDADMRARLRREYFGFVFQRYQLLGDLSALGNVETPAIYAGLPRHQRRERARALLVRLGLEDRLDHRPGQLSGGQQQRVSIARALMNGGQVILADEPTGALDTRSGEELMTLFADLNALGHTIVIVTHDMEVARHAHRIIEIRDGRIIADRQQEPARTQALIVVDRLDIPVQPGPVSSRPFWREPDRLGETTRLALLSCSAHRLRTFLTMLGIIIGIASVVCVVALGEGSRERILKSINAFGTNTIDIYAGLTPGDLRADMAQKLTLADVDALRAQSYVDSVTPVVGSSTTLRYRDVSVSAEVSGVGEAFFRVHGMSPIEGMAFDRVAVTSQAQEAVIDPKTRQTLFADHPAIGQVIFIDSMPARVIGVMAAPTGVESSGLEVWVPYTAMMTRMTGKFDVEIATIRIADTAPSDAAQEGITTLLTQRHGRRDFITFSNDTLRTLMTQTNKNLSLLISAIAFISLLVGGIGVMNIMLVSVSERIHEIGVRMAVGARQADIRNQFLIEAVFICLVGGLIGIVGALGIGLGASTSGGNYDMIFSPGSILIAFASATVIGVVFGFTPARQAARLDPVDALARE